MRSPRLLRFSKEAPSTGLTADEGKAQKLEGLRFTELTSSALLRSETAELDQAGLLRMTPSHQLWSNPMLLS